MTRNLETVRWIAYGLWALLAVAALLMAFTPGLELLGVPAERVTFAPATLTGLPWTLPLYITRLDSVTTLAIVMVANLLNAGIGFMLARGSG